MAQAEGRSATGQRPDLTRRQALAHLGGLGLLGLAGRFLNASPAHGADLVEASGGDLPIVITAPHGGRQAIPDVPRRTAGVLTRDVFTAELAHAVADHLASRLGRRPHLIVAGFDRQFLDANRNAARAYESPAAAPYYNAYHGAIREAVDQVRLHHGGTGLLLDLHGQGVAPDVLFRGTVNGLTVRHLLDTFGPEALTGPRSVFGQLAVHYRVDPADGPFEEQREDRRFVGGYTVRTHGSQHPDGIDAIQIETGADFRQPAPARDRFAADLAAALAEFADAYLDLADKG